MKTRAGLDANKAHRQAGDEVQCKALHPQLFLEIYATSCCAHSVIQNTAGYSMDICRSTGKEETV